MPRYFGKASPEALRMKVQAALDAHEDKDVDVGATDRRLVSLTPTVRKDLAKVQFDLENFDASDDESAAFGVKLGYHQLDNGMSFLGMRPGGDWEHPVYMIVYYDGRQLRGYIPTDGNPWNTATRKAYGTNDPKSDIRNAAKRGFVGQAVLDEERRLRKENPDPYGGDLDIVFEISGPDWAKIEADIKARILPRG